ncbi:PAS domain-containing sensor histidine kinase [Lignipirellula cremea]|uniref:histidine kinase n=1 Tax=Lignipirellula cremea TaxID=2528010 RepID=A0A518DRG1_9BACT|nr:PAS domain S-box protein [Lignipirellula cremea]QDU94413.1 Sensor histidine kinase LiaS [Lignipirellula cremea]
MSDPLTSAPEGMSTDAWLNLISSQIPAVMWTTNRKLEFTWGIGAGLKALGLRAHQLNGVSLHTYFKSDDPSFRPIDMHHRALAGQHVNYEQKWGGNVYESHLEPLRNDRQEIIGVVGIALDITRRVHAESQIKASAETFENLAHFLPAMLYQTRGNNDGSNFQTPYLSAFAEKFLGYTAEEVQKDPMLLLKAIHPDDQEAYYRKALASMANFTPFRFDFRAVAKDGVQRWLRACSQPDRLENNEMIYHGVAIDITDLVQERQELEQDVKRLSQYGSQWHQNLMFTTGKLTQETAQRTQIEQALQGNQRTLNDMVNRQDCERRRAADILHEDLLQRIIAAKYKLEGINLEQVGSHGRDLEETIVLLAEVIRQSTQLMSELHPTVPEGVSLTEALEQLVREAEMESDTKFDFIYDDIRPDTISKSLEVGVIRIVEEALSNIRRHSKALQATVELTQTSQCVMICIHDEGVGFNANEDVGIHTDEGGVFKPRQGDSANAQQQEEIPGGFRSIEQCVKLFGGRLTINSHPGQGARIHVELPTAIYSTPSESDFR